MIGLPIIWWFRTLAFATFLVWRSRIRACGVGACGFWRYRMHPAFLIHMIVSCVCCPLCADMFASEQEDSPEPVRSRSPSPPPARKIIDSDDEVIPPTPQTENDTKNRRKRKVVKDKSYMDEDGFVGKPVPPPNDLRNPITNSLRSWINLSVGCM